MKILRGNAGTFGDRRLVAPNITFESEQELALGDQF
jgi:hypothetical protein